MMKNYGIEYKDAEPHLHDATCSDFARSKSPYRYTHVSPNLDAAVLEAADNLALSLDLFDQRYDTVEEARELSLKCVHVNGCAK